MLPDSAITYSPGERRLPDLSSAALPTPAMPPPTQSQLTRDEALVFLALSAAKKGKRKKRGRKEKEKKKRKGNRRKSGQGNRVESTQRVESICGT